MRACSESLARLSRTIITVIIGIYYRRLLARTRESSKLDVEKEKNSPAYIYYRTDYLGHLTRLEIIRFVDVSATAVFNQLTRRRLRVCVRSCVDERERACRPARSLAHVRYSFCFPSLSLSRSLSLCPSDSLPIVLSKTPRLHLPLLFICEIIARFMLRRY